MLCIIEQITAMPGARQRPTKAHTIMIFISSALFHCHLLTWTYLIPHSVFKQSETKAQEEAIIDNHWQGSRHVFDQSMIPSTAISTVIVSGPHLDTGSSGQNTGKVPGRHLERHVISLPNIHNTHNEGARFLLYTRHQYIDVFQLLLLWLLNWDQFVLEDPTKNCCPGNQHPGK